MYTYLNKYNCKRLTGFTFTQIIYLSGIQSEHPGIMKLIDQKKLKHQLFEFEDSVALLEFQTPLLIDLTVRIYTKTGIIKNDLIEASHLAKENIALRILVAQVDTARELNFKKMYANAFGDPISLKMKINNYRGFLFWGRYGYRMVRASQNEFRNLMIKFGKNEKTIQDLQSTKAGRDFWTENGHDWLGEFNLSTRSKSMKILNAKRKEKGL